MTSTNDQAATVAEEAVADHEGQFYCGLCGWVDIVDYGSHGHPEQKGQ